MSNSSDDNHFPTGTWLFMIINRPFTFYTTNMFGCVRTRFGLVNHKFPNQTPFFCAFICLADKSHTQLCVRLESNTQSVSAPTTPKLPTTVSILLNCLGYWIYTLQTCTYILVMDEREIPLSMGKKSCLPIGNDVRI